MAFETKPRSENRRNYEIGGHNEFHIEEGASLTVPGASFLETPSEIQQKHGIETPLFLKAIVNPNTSPALGGSVMIFEVDETVKTPEEGDTLFALPQEQLRIAQEASGKTGGITLEELESYVQWLTPNRRSVSALDLSFAAPFVTEVDDEGSIKITSRSKDGTDVIAPIVDDN